MKIVVALGNPGDKYKKTRHNVAWQLLDNYLGNVNWQENKKFQALIYQDVNYMFVKPLTFMNNSGLSVKKIMSYYKLLPKKFSIFNKKDADINKNLLVIQDDVDILFGKFKQSSNSTSAGHRGIKSIIENLNTKNFSRLRIGIKNDLLRTVIPTEKFVLQNFSSEELKELENIFTSIDLEKILKEDIIN